MARSNKIKVIDKKFCPRCQKEMVASNFYSADPLLYPDGKFHLDKACVEEIIENGGTKAFLTILRAMNKPFLEDIYKGDYKDYLRMVSSLPQYRNLTYDHSKNSEVKVPQDDIEEGNDILISDDLRKKWRSFNEEEIEFLENYYQELITTYESETPIQRNLYKNMAITQLKADQAIIDKSITEYDKLMKTLSNLMSDAKLKPVQENSADTGGLSTWGEWVKKIEETEPMPEVSEELKDVDGFKKYIDHWFVRHFAKIFGLINDEEVDKVMLIENSEVKDGEVTDGNSLKP